MSSIANAVRGKRVPLFWVLLFLGMAGVNAAVLLRGDAAPRSSQAVVPSHAPPPTQINARRTAPDPEDHSAADGEAHFVPRLTFSTTRLDLGSGKPDEILRGELTLTNPNSSPVAFSLIKHCGCTELSPMSGTIAPVSHEAIKVGVRLASHANSEKNTSVEVRTGEPATIVARCLLSARCPAPFLVTPSFINFGALAQEELADASHEIQLSSVVGQAALDAERLLIEQTGEAFAIDHVPPLSGESIILRVSLKRDLQPGDHYDTLDLRQPDSDGVMRVSLRATVVEPITVVPNTICLRRDGDREEFASKQLLVISRAGSEPRGPISLADGPPGVRVDDLGEVSPGRRRIRLSVGGSIANWPDKSEVWLRDEAGGARIGFKLLKPSS